MSRVPWSVEKAETETRFWSSLGDWARLNLDSAIWETIAGTGLFMGLGWCRVARAPFDVDVCIVTHYTWEVIRTFRHKGLRRLFLEDDRRGVSADHADKLRRILARLHAARTVSDMDLPGYRLHPLKGELKGMYAVTVQANWRVAFRFEDGEARDVDYLDYH
ncbi:MAG TPA: type II toxin-antitoxin system RelE/ParE family toxin [Candidatus Acidoferrum sp.]|nr:type II toxin-antitoxin system RelE/ParE family toxin [Candidatus Acidoferrum sp.]